MLAYDKEAWRASNSNGRIDARLLRDIVPTQYDPDLMGPAVMHPEAAAAMSALLRQAYADGVTELKVKYSYRTYTVQLVKWANYQAGGNLAATPGTSNHGWAVSVDFTGLTARALAWIRDNARTYGFINDVPSENWHYTFQEGLWEGEVADMAVLTPDEERQLRNFLAELRTKLGEPTARVAGERVAAAVKKVEAGGAPGEAHEHNLIGKAK